MVRSLSKPSRDRLVRFGLVAVLAVAGCAARPAAAGGESGVSISVVASTSVPGSPTFASTSSVPDSRTSGSGVGSVTASGIPSTTSPPSSSSSTPSAGPTAIEGKTWLLVRAVVDGKTYDSPQPAGASVYGSYTVRFVKGRLEANDACNSLDVAAAVNARTVAISGNVGQTDVGCSGSPLRAAYDRELFEGSLGWAVADGRLTLTVAGGNSFEYEALPTGYPSDLAGVKHATTSEKSIDGVRFRIYALRRDGGDQCLTMEFNAPAGTPWETISACRDELAAQYVVNPTDFTSGRLPSGTGYMFSAVPNGSTSRIVFRPSGGGPTTTLTQIPLPGTKFQVFYGFVEHQKGGGTVTFYDKIGKAYKDVWNVT